MTKLSFGLAFLAVALMAAPCAAATATAASAGDSKPATQQQSRMKSCAAEYHAKKIAKAQYRSFMSQCLRTHPKAGKTTAAATKTPSDAQ